MEYPSSVKIKKDNVTTTTSDVNEHNKTKNLDLLSIVPVFFN